MKSHRKLVALAITVLLISAIVGFAYSKAEALEEISGDTYSYLKLFTRALAIIESKYVDEVDIKKLIYGAINGMLQSLDPHSSFLDPDFFKQLTVDTSGSFGGLGIEISTKNGYIAVIAPIDDTPAAKAGILAGDLIVKIEGESTKGMSLMDAVKKMRGKPDTDITISIWRKGMIKPKDIVITRAIIEVKSVKQKDMEPGYGYIKVSQFNATTARNLEKALNKLESQNGEFKGLVLDLRNNPGGLLDQAQKVADKFIDSGLIVYTKGRIQSQEMRLTASKPGTHPNYPMVVLVNGGSASASEIVAGALQDHNRAIIVGENTFGKGSVQTILQLDDGSGIKLTTSKYFTPLGRDIQAKGIVPDFVVSGNQWAGVDEEHKNFFRSKEADLQNRLKNIDEKDESGDQPEFDLPEDDSGDGTSKAKDDDRDYQLEYALSLLKSWEVFKKVAQ